VRFLVLPLLLAAATPSTKGSEPATGAGGPAAAGAPAAGAASAPAAPAKNGAPSSSTSSGPAALGAAAQPYMPGERMELAVTYAGAPIGRARISVGSSEGVLLPVRLEARTSGLAGVFKLREILATYLDVRTGLPRTSTLDAVEGGYKHSATADYDRDRSRVKVREIGKHDNRYEVEVPPGTLDFVALVFRLRTLPLEVGARHSFDVLAGRDVSRVVAEVMARETVTTDAGAFSAWKVRVPTSFTGKFSEKSPTYVWFSDDARRVVVRIATEFAIGRATADLDSYTPGIPTASQ
jgi:Protein of unknown function (DUF3108)